MQILPTTRLLLLTTALVLTGCVNALIQEKAAPQASSSMSLPPFLAEKSIASSSAPLSLASADATKVLLKEIGSGNLLEIGNPKTSPLYIFTNQSCGYCKRFWNELVPLLRSDFVNTGKLRLRIAILPMNKYPASMEEASALFCAQKQGKGSEIHEALFSLESHSTKTILAAAKLLKLDSTSFVLCTNSEEAKSAAETQKKLAEQLQITLAPTLVLSGERLVGLPAYADLRTWIESTLELRR